MSWDISVRTIGWCSVMANNMHCSTQTDIRSVSNLEEMASDMPSVVQYTVERKVLRKLRGSKCHNH